MLSSNDQGGDRFERPPFVYEIRVKGRLSGEQWTSWFDDLDVSTARGESTLRGRVPDHAALYGLLGRLRDLAVPLVAVKVLDADAQLTLSRSIRRYDLLINGLFVVLYLLILGALTAITVLAAPVINTALALALLFAALAGLAHGFGLWTGQALWRWVGYVSWLSAAVSFLVFIPVSGILPTPLALAIVLLIGAGGLFYGLIALRRALQDARSRLAGGALPPGDTLLPSAEAGAEPGDDEAGLPDWNS
ncbi:MAG TPA: hypothetical protein VLC52_17215 [Anaerolineae bacterium]|nr:hypothetical protein [Anaerolineae bacterium]